MDFAFAPGRGKEYTLARQLFALRPNTNVIQGRTLRTIADFFTHLNTTGGLTLPAEDLYIVSHGNDHAWTEIHLDGTQKKGPTGFEQADAAVRGHGDPFHTGVTSGSVEIPTDVNHDSNGDLGSMATNFRGCRIGVAEPFVDKLKEAFGGESPVTAPKRFYWIERLGGVGMMEFLLYSFGVVNKTALTDKAAVIDALDAAPDLTFIDSSKVPTANWNDWVPKDVSRGRRPAKKKIYLNFGQTLGTRTGIPFKIEFRHEVPRFGPYEITGLSPMPAKADQLETLRQTLKDDANQPGSRFASGHPFPVFKRYRQSNIDDFVDNLSWAFTPDAAHSTLACVGSQHEYTVLVPITDPPDLKTGNLIFNFYPSPGSTAAVVENPKLFTTEKTMFYTA
jgi:hypothetical protein